MIEITHLSKSFDSKIAVDDLNLIIEKELYIFLGPNGAGKTTTIKMITGLLHPQSGFVRVNGYDIQKQPLAAKRQFGLVSENPFLYEKLTAREFVQFIAGMYGVTPFDCKRRMDNLFDLFELSDSADNLIQTFSHGMKQKIAITAALIHDPKVLILDEPTSGLDPKSARNLKDILKGLVKKGTTIFMSTHILEIAERMCDRVGIINKGKLCAEGTMEELRSQSHDKQSLEDIFLELTGGTEYAEISKFLDDR
jgi:ABC-2 type transport system ATP-binding protein